MQVEVGLLGDTGRPGLVEVALAMARLMDGPAVSCKPSAAKQLRDALAALRESSTPGRSKLAVVRALTGGDTPGA